MIDLAKPIRRKADLRPVEVRVDPCPVEICFGTRIAFIDMEELERDYENIPEPRKPKEWLIVENVDCFAAVDPSGPAAFNAHRNRERTIRVIEWPAGAPLPEWPE